MWTRDCAFVLQRVGRCDTYSSEADLEADEYVPLPKGDVHKKKEIVQDVTLNDLDHANARPQVGHLAFGAPAWWSGLSGRHQRMLTRVHSG